MLYSDVLFHLFSNITLMTTGSPGALKHHAGNWFEYCVALHFVCWWVRFGNRLEWERRRRKNKINNFVIILTVHSISFLLCVYFKLRQFEFNVNQKKNLFLNNGQSFQTKEKINEISYDMMTFLMKKKA